MEAIAIIAIIFIAFPAVVLIAITNWKKMRTLSTDDESLMDNLNQTANRLEERVMTIERILTAENPDWKQKF